MVMIKNKPPSLQSSAVRQLIKTANKSDVRAKVAAIAITRTGELIAHASNQILYGFDDKFSIHAEHALINKLKRIRAFERHRGRFTIVVLRLGKYGEARTAKPCLNCQHIMSPYSDRINVLYTEDGGRIQQL